jgi:hypothetical protein
MDGLAKAPGGSRRLLIAETQVLSPACRGGIYDGKSDKETNVSHRPFKAEINSQ